MEKFFKKMEELEGVGSSLTKSFLIERMLVEEPEAEEYFRLAFSDVVYNCDEQVFYHAFPKPEDQSYAHVSDFLAIRNKEVPSSEVDINDVKRAFKEIEDRSGYNQVTFIHAYFSILSALEAKWLCRALLKDLRCGVKIKTVNKVLKKLKRPEISKFELQLCDTIDVLDSAEVQKHLKFPVYAECKYDGIRTQAEIYIDADGRTQCKLTSRRGKDRTEHHPDIVQELCRVFKDCPCILDGEVKAESFQKLTRKDDTSPRKYVVWDLLVDEKLPYISRWDNLVNLFEEKVLGSISNYMSETDEWKYASNIVFLVEHYTIENEKELVDYYNALNDRHEEGIIIKLLDRPYERGTRKHMFKCKKVLDADLLIVGYKYGEGKRVNFISTLCLLDRSGKVSCDVGSGIDDAWAETLTKDPDSFLGRICQIQYSELTETGSVRFPRFITVREDKEEEDDLWGS